MPVALVELDKLTKDLKPFESIDMALLKARQFIVFEGTSKSGVYKLNKVLKTKLKL